MAGGGGGGRVDEREKGRIKKRIFVSNLSFLVLFLLLLQLLLGMFF